MDFNTLLKKDFILLDGGTGTEYIKLGMEQGYNPLLLNFTHPDWVESVAKSYVDAGSDIICTNTFGACRYKLDGTGYTTAQVIEKAVSIARSAAKSETLIALDVSTTGMLLEPTGSLTFEEAYESYKEIVLAGEKAGADVIFLETMSDIYEVKAAILAAKENCSLPIFASMTFERGGRTFTGTDVASFVLTAEGLGVSALGVNCALGPDELGEVVDELLKWASVPVIVKPNAGLPDPSTGKFHLKPEEYCGFVATFAKKGAKLLGGCCGTSPEYISLIKSTVANICPEGTATKRPSAVCSGTKTVVIDSPRIIGERINPTGKKLFKEALRRGDIDYILSQALQQTSAGAELLDVNVGLPEIDEKAMMVRAVKAVQSVTNAPLQLDSTVPEVLDAGLRVYNGKPIVNSVNGEEKSLSAILPLVKKYGAAVVGLTLDENGIPKTAEERFAIAERILERALALGIPREDVYIDCLTLTASAEQAAVAETLKALNMVKERLGLRTVLGVSNISFGLPNRELVNHTFLSMALDKGLDLPIMNPNISSMTGVVRAYRVLMNIDRNSTEFVAAYGGEEQKSIAPTAADITLEYAVQSGLKNDAARITRELLKTTDPMTIINSRLIPILDEVGAKFEKGTIFLPQLISAADTSGVCFEEIKAAMRSNDGAPESKGKIILATVKGDIHDIGKNIVKVLLENYGYEVIDLGRDVPEQLIVDTAIEQKVLLVGLSALMTTTLPSMAGTIKLLRENNVPCKVMVGGAVLTQEYADSIGADFYGKDAKASVDYAKTVFGK